MKKLLFRSVGKTTGIFGNIFKRRQNQEPVSQENGVPRYIDEPVLKPTFKDVYTVLGEYSEAEVVGSIARSAYAEIRLLERKRANLMRIIATRFPVGSLSHGRFVSVVEVACDTVLESTMALANRIQVFDVSEYRRTRYLLATGAYRDDDIPDEIQEERWRLFQENKEEMREIVRANERMLLELDRLAVEIGRPDVEAVEEGERDVVDEIHQLMDEVKYYV